MIAKILVPVRGDGKGDNVLAHAAALGRRSNAHIAVTHARTRAEDMLPYGVPLPGFLKDRLIESAAELADVVEEKLQGELEALASQLGLTMTDGVARKDVPTASWTEEQGKQVDVIRNFGRLADLICVAQPDLDANIGTNTLKAALFNTGTPVMMCPPQDTAPEALGVSVTIGWNGSHEASRAVSMTRDLLAAADVVTILSTGEAPHPALTAEKLQEHLALRGIDARLDRFKTTGNAGLALLERSAGLGADMLVMGAYGDSHERETLFGGNTQAVVDQATMPVILVH